MESTFTVHSIAKLLDCPFSGPGDLNITGVAPIDVAREGQVSFIANEKYLRFLNDSQASVVIIQPAHAAKVSGAAILSNNPYYTFAKVASLFQAQQKHAPGIHPTAVIGEHCDIDPSAYIGPYCVIEDYVTVGREVCMQSHCYVGHSSQIGHETKLMNNVTLHNNSVLGKRNTIASGVVIGADGFGFAQSGDNWHKVPQLGGTYLGDDVDVGANTTIDRGTLANTIIEAGVKIDNQVQVAHNVVIGQHTVIAGCVGIAGSAKIGRCCAIGGATCIGGHIEIADHVKLTGMSMVTSSIKRSGLYSSGTGLDETSRWRKNIARFKQLDTIVRIIKRLQASSAVSPHAQHEKESEQ